MVSICTFSTSQRSLITIIFMSVMSAALCFLLTRSWYRIQKQSNLRLFSDLRDTESPTAAAPFVPPPGRQTTLQIFSTFVSFKYLNSSIESIPYSIVTACTSSLEKTKRTRAVHIVPMVNSFNVTFSKIINQGESFVLIFKFIQSKKP